MKIEPSRGVSSGGAARAGGASAAPGFSPAVEAPVRIAATSAASAVAPLDALLALQADEPLAQRRARQARRGRQGLDALERLADCLLLGRAPSTLRGELEALRGGGAPSGDADLDAILLEIDTRLAVEAAKLELQNAR